MATDSLSWLSEEDNLASIPVLLAPRSEESAFLLVGYPWHTALTSLKKQHRSHCVVFSLAEGVEKQRQGKGSSHYDGAHYSIMECSGARSHGSVLLFPGILITLRAELPRYGS